MNIDLTPILQALIGLLSAAVTMKLVPWLKARTEAQNGEMLRALVKTLVFAAEQLYRSGEQRLSYVKRELEKRGLHVDIAVIEAAVCELKILFSTNNQKNIGDDTDGD